MLGGVADSGPTWAHWVPLGAAEVNYRYGRAWIASCTALCVPARAGYLEHLQACPQCDQRERGFMHRPAAEPVR
jgi:hypothetical protein